MGGQRGSGGRPAQPLPVMDDPITGTLSHYSRDSCFWSRLEQ